MSLLGEQPNQPYQPKDRKYRSPHDRIDPDKNLEELNNMEW